MKSSDDLNGQPVIQREMGFFMPVKTCTYVDKQIVDSWQKYRDAVVWCWENRKHSTCNSKDDQATFVRLTGMHPPHMSRCVNADSPNPMKLSVDLIPEFQAYTGWKGLSQFIAKDNGETLMEEVIESRKAA